jgi:hypothetical protein
MRAPKRRRPRRDQRLDPAQPGELIALSERVSYIISSEHKDYLTSAGPGKLRSDATACPRGLDFEVVEAWLKQAVAAGQVSADRDGEFPRYVWTNVDGSCYEARLSNSALGQYKGYPIQDSEAPGWLR